MTNISAVIVTYNRANLLERTINAVLSQTVLPDVVYIINNASTDDTKNVCEKFINLKATKIILINREINDGGAGGFAYGLKKILNDSSAEYCWLMDDDVEPERDCLEKLLAYKNFSGFIHPFRFYDSDQEQPWRQVYMPSLGFAVSLNYNEDYEVYATNVGCFEGCLISRKIVEKLGVPFEDFFIAEDDTLYGFLASFFTPVLLVKNARMKRLIKPSSGIPLWKIFYLIRNKIWMLKIIYNKGVLKKINIITNFLGLSLFSVLILKSNKFSGFSSVLKGWKDGIFKNPRILKK